MIGDLTQGLTNSNLMGNAGGDAGGDGALPILTLDGVETSTCFDCDVTLPSGYSGTTLFNKIENPNDGASQSDYDFTAVDMTLSGTAGTSAAKLTQPTGGGYLQILNPAGPFIRNIGRSGTSGWLAAAWLTNDSTGDLFLFDSRNNTVDSGNGLAIRKRGNETFNLLLNNQGGLIQVASTSNTMPLNTPVLTIFSWDGTNVRFWVNNTATSEIESLSFSTDTDLINDEAFYAMQNYLGSNSGDSSTELKGIYGGDDYINDTRASNISGVLEARHGETYF